MLAEVIWQSFLAGIQPSPAELLPNLDEATVTFLSRLTMEADQGPEKDQALEDSVKIILLARLNEEYETHRMQADEMLRQGDLNYVQELMNAQRILTKISELAKSPV